MKRALLLLPLLVAAAPGVARARPQATAVAASPAAPAAPLGPNDKLQYYGGHVLSSVEVVAVFWTSAVNMQIQTDIGKFYQTIVTSPWIDWLTEYDSIGLTGYSDMKPGSNQHIGRGSFLKSVVITPSNQSKNLTDSDVQAELVAQIQAGNLPQPTFDAQGGTKTLYMIDFPPGYTITLVIPNVGSIVSCQSYGAYHYTTTLNGKTIPYGIHPDCGYGWNGITYVHSHELMEAITDTEVGLVVQAGPEVRPLGWATVAQTTWANQEICDICEGGPNASQMLAGYNVATGWSNFAMACVAEIPICTFGVQPPECRPCNEFDDGQACSGALPACATKGPRQGYCVPCTTKYADGCTGATPVCDDELNTCVQCGTSADCKDPNAPRCEAATNTCGPCKVDADCPAGDKCVADADAGGGRCEKPPAPPMDAGGAPHPDAGGGVDAGDDGGNGDQPGSGNSGGCGCGLVGGGGDGGGARGAAELLAIAAALGASLVARRRRSR